MRTLFITLLSCVALIANAVDTNKKFYIFHSSGMVLSAVDGRPNLHTFDATNGQVFQFVATGSNYFIKSVSKNSNVAKTGDWDTELSTGTGNVAKFSVDEEVESVEIEAMDGSVVMFISDEPSSISVSGLVKGVYVVKATTSNGQYVGKFVKE